MFDFLCLLGATYTKLQFHLYNESDNHDCDASEPHEYIVEAQRLCGDGFAFNSIFGEVRSALCSEECSVASCPSSSQTSASSRSSRSPSLTNSSASSYSSSPCASSFMMEPLTDDEKSLFVEPIIKMTDTTASMESQLEGCRLLCDMIVSNHNFHEQLCACGAVDVLMRLMMSDSFLTCQHAVIALTALSKCDSCMKTIWANISADTEAGLTGHKGFVNMLCNQFVDGPYYSEAKRRQSAELLTNMLEYQTRQRHTAAPAATACQHFDMVNMRILSPRGAGGDFTRSRSATTLAPVDGFFSPQGDSVVSDCASRLNDDVLERCISRIEVALEQDFQRQAANGSL